MNHRSILVQLKFWQLLQTIRIQIIGNLTQIEILAIAGKRTAWNSGLPDEIEIPATPAKRRAWTHGSFYEPWRFDNKRNIFEYVQRYLNILQDVSIEEYILTYIEIYVMSNSYIFLSKYVYTYSQIYPHTLTYIKIYLFIACEHILIHLNRFQQRLVQRRLFKYIRNSIKVS